jgi:hypothetical protein
MLHGLHEVLPLSEADLADRRAERQKVLDERQEEERKAYEQAKEEEGKWEEKRLAMEKKREAMRQAEKTKEENEAKTLKLEQAKQERLASLKESLAKKHEISEKGWQHSTATDRESISTKSTIVVPQMASAIVGALAIQSAFQKSMGIESEASERVLSQNTQRTRHAFLPPGKVDPERMPSVDALNKAMDNFDDKPVFKEPKIIQGYEQKCDNPEEIYGKPTRVLPEVQVAPAAAVTARKKSSQIQRDYFEWQRRINREIDQRLGMGLGFFQSDDKLQEEIEKAAKRQEGREAKKLAKDRKKLAQKKKREEAHRKLLELQDLLPRPEDPAFK